MSYRNQVGHYSQRRVYGPLTQAAAYQAGRAAHDVVRWGLRRAGRGAMDYWNSESKESAPPRRKKSQSKRSTFKFKEDGVTGGRALTGRKRRRKRRKKSLRQQISAVKKLIPPMSRKTWRDFDFLIMKGDPNVNTAEVNHHTIYDISCFGPNDFEQFCGQLTKVDTNTNYDYATENSRVKFDIYYKLTCKNNMTSNAVVKYSFMVCKDDDAEEPIDDIREELLDRGYTGIPLVQAFAAKSAIRNKVPARLELDETTPWHVPVFSGVNLTRKWTVVGVKSVTMGPGDTIDMIYSKKNIVYRPEILDNENFDNLKGYSFRLVISLHGDLVHDSVNHRLIGRGDAQLDCEETRIATCKYANPKGLNEVVYTDGIDNTGIVVAEHADNMASAIEVDGN